MRLNGDYRNYNDENDNRNGNEINPMTASSSSSQLKLVVGYALTSKKVKSFLQPKLEGFARSILAAEPCRNLHVLQTFGKYRMIQPFEFPFSMGSYSPFGLRL